MLPNSEYGKFSENLQGTGVPLIIYQRQRKAKVGRDSARASASGAGGGGGRDATMTDGAIADLVTLEIVKGETSLTWGGRFATLADKTQGWGFNDVQRRAEAQARETMADAVQKSGDPAEAKVHQKLQRTNSTRVGGKALRMQQVNRVVVRVKPKPPGAICRCPPLSCLLGRHPDPIRSSDNLNPSPCFACPLSPPLLPFASSGGHARQRGGLVARAPGVAVVGDALQPHRRQRVAWRAHAAHARGRFRTGARGAGEWRLSSCSSLACPCCLPRTCR